MSNLFSKLGPLTAVVAVVGAMAFATPQQAQAEDAGPNLGNVSVSIGTDIVTEYWFRGFLQEDDGLIVQPWGEVGFSFPEFAESLGVDDVYAYVGVWASVHDEETGAGGSITSGTMSDMGPFNPAAGHDGFYEFDLYGGGGVVIGKFDLSLGYTAYYSPSGAFDLIEEITLGVAYDDSELWGDSLGGGFSLSPYFMVAIEVNNEGGDENIYGEIGVEPSWVIIESEGMPVTLAVPLVLGFSIDDYYTDGSGDDEFFGYFSISGVLSVPLAFIPAEYGSWEASAGVTYLIGNDDDINGEDDAFFAIFGISMSY